MKRYTQEHATYLLKQLLDNTSDNIYFKDINSRIILVNKAYARWMGSESPEAFIGKTDFDLFADEHARDAFEDEQHIIQTGVPIIGKEEKETWANGKITWVSTTKMPLKDDRGNIVGTFGISRNITEHMLSEIQLKKYTKKMCRINEKMEEELHMAANLQRAFLPQSYPSFTDSKGNKLLEFSHFYDADIQIGGDFCSVHKLSSTKAGVLICDVMGHGVQAALVTGLIRTMSNNLVHTVEMPGQLFTAMNSQLFPILQSKGVFIFATASYLIIDVETGLLSGASAGHPAPIHIQRQQNRAALMNPGQKYAGPALAVMKNFEFKSFTMPLTPGDSVLMYTDGLHELVNEAGEEFGTANLINSAQMNRQLPLSPLIRALTRSAREYSATGKFNDDACLIGFTLSPHFHPGES